MSFKTATPAEEARQFAFSHNGQAIYHCLRWCGRISLGFIYATDPLGIHAEKGNPKFIFDVRDQPGGDKIDRIRADVDDHKKVIKAALEAGRLRTIADVHKISTNTGPA